MANTVTVTYRIDKISQLQYSILSKPSNFQLDQQNIDFRLTTKLLLPLDYRGVVIVLEVIGIDKRNDEQLFSFVTENKFDVLNYEVIQVSDDKKEFLIPDAFMVDILSLSIGAARGMLVIRNAGTYLNDVILPIYNPQEILKGFKAANGTEKPIEELMNSKEQDA